MADADAAPTPLPSGRPVRARPTAEQRYPKYDLMTCIDLADKVKNKGGNDCSVEQLGAFLGYTNTTGGGFATKVANARAFGLIETVQGRYRITPRAETLLYPASEAERQQALTEAFLDVPMYGRVYEMHRGQRLPEALGLKNLLHREFQIPVGDQVTLALRVMMDSAEQAGMFQATQGQRTKMVLPVIGSASTITERRDTRQSNSGSGGGGGGDDVDHADRGDRSGRVDQREDGRGLPPVHGALAGLLTLIPASPGPWSGRDAFDSAWKSTMDVLYPKAAAKSESAEGEAP
jgi:hypothetical protein